ncbi:MAG: DUF4012 domain-containing protein [Acidimicrobiales bacterium]
MEGDRRVLAHPDEHPRPSVGTTKELLTGLPTGPTRRPISRPPARRRPPLVDTAGAAAKGGHDVAVEPFDDELAWPSDLIGADEVAELLARAAPPVPPPAEEPVRDERAKVRAELAAGATMPYDLAFVDDRPATTDASSIAELVKGSFGPSLREAPVEGLAIEVSDDGEWIIPEEKRHRDTVVFHDRPRHETTAAERVALVALTAVSTFVAVTTGAAPTGVWWVDVAWCAALVGLMVVSAARARRWVLVLAAALVCMGGAGVCLAAGAVALLGTAVMVLRDDRNRVLGGLVGAAIAVGALEFPTSGSSSWFVVVPVAACILVLQAGYGNATPGGQARVRRGAKVAGAAFGLLVALAVVMVLSARSSVSKGITETQAAADAVATGDQEQAAVRLDAASTAFDRAHGRLGFVGAAPIQLVPVLAQNYRAIRDATGEGAQVTEALGTEVTTLDYDRLNRPDGGIDTEVLRSYGAPVHRVDDELRSSIRSLDALRSTWLVPPVRHRIVDLGARLRGYQEGTALASLAVDRGPAILGADGTRRYLILLGNPAEARDLGGHLGQWAELTITDGTMHLVQVGSPRDLALPVTPAATASLDGYPPSLVDMDPLRFPQNWGSDPDLTKVAKLAGQLFEERTGRSIDGVAYADPQAFAAIVGLTGPQAIAGTQPPVRVSDRTAADFMMSGQYAAFPTEQAANEATQALVHDVFESLTHTRLPSPRGLGDQFGPLVDQGRLSFTSLHPDDQPLLAKMGTDRAMPAIDGTNLVGLVDRNANPSKIDYYLHRTAKASYRWNPETGDVSGVVTVRLTNTAPRTGLSPVVIGNDPRADGDQRHRSGLLTRFAPRWRDGRWLTRADVQLTGVGNYWRDTALTVPAGRTVVVRYRSTARSSPVRTTTCTWSASPWPIRRRWR